MKSSSNYLWWKRSHGDTYGVMLGFIWSYYLRGTTLRVVWRGGQTIEFTDVVDLKELLI